MKTRLCLLLLIVSCTISCSTVTHVTTPYEVQIHAKQKQLQDDGKMLLAKANSILESINSNKSNKSNDPRIAQALDLLEKSQAAFGVTIADQVKLANLTPEELDKKTDLMLEKDLKIADDILDLKQKNTEDLQKTAAVNEQYKAIVEEQRANRRKWYFIGSLLLAGVGVFMFYAPPGVASNVLGSVFSIFKK